MVYKSKPISESTDSDKGSTGSCDDGSGDACKSCDLGISRDSMPGLQSLSPSITTIDSDLLPQRHNGVQSGGGIFSSQHLPRKGPYEQKKRLFGIPQNKYVRDNILPDDYDARYPSDQIGHEMGPNARVWRVYLDEAELNDRDMVESWKDGIDVLLVFAGLFSAVVTTFVTQTSQKLDQDHGSISVSLLAEVVAIQRTVAVGGLVSDVPAADPGPGSSPRYTNGDVWVNALWFTSLTLSLVTALSAVLIKQWIQHYVSFVSGTAQERARIRQFRYAGLEKWGVRGIMSVLPVLLYAALFLFISGMFVFLQALKTEIAIVVGVIGGIAFILYVVTNGLPLFYPECPYYTPLIEPIHTATNFAAFTYHQLTFYIIRRTIPQFLSLPAVACLRNLYRKQNQTINSGCRIEQPVDPPKYEPFGHKLSESQAATSDQDKITEDIISWLLTMTSNPSVKPIALQSISGLPVGFSRIPTLLGEDSLVRHELVNEDDKQYSVISAEDLSRDGPSAFIDSPLFYKRERTIRACLFIPGEHDQMTFFHNWERFDEAVADLGDGVPLTFKQALVTYRVNSFQGLYELLPGLVDTMKGDPALWHAWTHGLNKYNHRLSSIIEVYSHFSQLFRKFLAIGYWDDEYDEFYTILSFLCRLSPRSFIKEYFDYPPEQRFALLGVTTLTMKVKFCAMALQGVIDEWDRTKNQHFELNSRTQITALIIDISSNHVLYAIYHSSKLDAGPAGEAIRKLLDVLNTLIVHPSFIESRMERNTYSHIFAIYELVVNLKPASTSNAPDTNNLFSSYERIRTILAAQKCMHGLWGALFATGPYHLHCHDIPFQIITTLEGQAANSQMLQNAFDAFSELDWTKKYLEEKIFGATEYSDHWAPTAQPIVRWMLDHVMTHSGTESSRAPVDALAGRLIDRRGFLTFACSPFLITDEVFSRMNIVISKESDVLLRLAAFHKDKPGAVDAWNNFLSWIQNRSNKLYKDEKKTLRSGWTGEDFKKYGRMADFVDQLASSFGFNDPEFKIPRFEESYITEFLKKQQRTPDTQAPKPVTSPSASKSWSSLFRKLLPGGGQRSADAAGDVDLESNQKSQGAD